MSLVKENKNKKNEDNTNDAIEKKKKKTRKCVAGQQQVRQSKYTLELGDKVTLIEVRRGARGLVFPL